METAKQTTGVGLNALELLKQDHRQMKNLFDQYRKDSANAEEVCIRICGALEIHSRIEEEVFYPLCEEKLDGIGKTLVKESIEDHHRLDELVERIHHIPQGSKELSSKMDEVITSASEHIETEESELFPLVRQKLLAAELEQLGAELQERKDELVKAEPVVARVA